MRRIFSIIGIIILMIAAAAGAYLYQQQRINSLESDRDSLSRELQIARAENDRQRNNSENNQQKSTTYTSEKGVTVEVSTPERDSEVSSPLNVAGKVPGSWSFEAQFAIRLLDKDGQIITEKPVTLQGDWTTDSLVPFSTTLTYDNQPDDKGLLVLVKANPSGLAENDDKVTIPVEF